MNHKFLVSIIIPSYNRANYLLEAIESVLAQTYKPIELIIVDDGSNDNTYLCVDKYLKNHCVRYYYQQNKGVSSARNTGIKLSRGEYISFLDSDDLWDKRKLEYQMSFILSQSEYYVCYTDEIWIRNGVRVNYNNRYQKYSGYIYKHCLPLCIIGPSSILLKREVVNDIGLFDESLAVCEDYDYWLRLSLKYPIYFFGDKLVIKRGGHYDQLSHKYDCMDRFRVKAITKIIENNTLSIDDYNETISMMLKKCEILKNGYYKHGKTKEGDCYNDIIKKYSQNLVSHER
ncbi:MAG: glycosyltransferase [Spirochaetota bacterium]|nr:glycosyltransferase [Spirochaetota bacterium]